MFQVKVYNSINTTLKKTISPKDVLSDISFSMNLNGGLWQQTIELAYSITDTSISLWDIIKITMFNDNNKDWVQIYMWYVSKINRKQTTTRQTIVLTCLWIASLLTEEETTTSFAWLSAGDYVKQIIDAYNASYWVVFSYTSSSIDAGWTMNSWYVKWTYLKCLNDIVTMQWYNLFIDWQWVVYFKAQPTTSTHFLTNKKDLESIEIKEDLESVINSINVAGKYKATLWWSVYYDNYVYWTHEDATSVATYWRRFKQEEILTSSQTVVDDYAQQFVNDNKDPIKETTLVINRKYNIESIHPWHTIKIRNFEYALDNVKIIKISYTPDKAVLHLDKYISFGEQVIKTWIL